VQRIKLKFLQTHPFGEFFIVKYFGPSNELLCTQGKRIIILRNHIASEQNTDDTDNIDTHRCKVVNQNGLMFILLALWAYS
jgi:hypothetical protein